MLSGKSPRASISFCTGSANVSRLLIPAIRMVSDEKPVLSKKAWFQAIKVSVPTCATARGRPNRSNDAQRALDPSSTVRKIEWLSLNDLRKDKRALALHF